MKEDIKKNQTNFQLRPFKSEPLMEKVSIAGSLTRTADTLLVEYTLSGALKNIKKPVAFATASRCHELWRHTCFELFFGIRNDPGYWEVNYCPSGRWNVYRFDDYRLGMREDHSVGRPFCKITEVSDCLTLSCCLNLNGIIDSSCILEAGVCSVIETIDGSLCYWAVEHQRPKPDFHNRCGFLVVLPE